uniref:Phosphatidic acid phosphatase type 2/haloperoxidase domain-containing protein n=1 Tax=Romanomermis culicivorax TaxID=13658 RepID=A0A915JEC1_ROMCU
MQKKQKKDYFCTILHPWKSQELLLFIVLYVNLKTGEFKSLTALLTKYGTQFTLIIAASCVSLSRITDNAHHWSDVLVGTIAGVLVATTFVRLCASLATTSHAIRCLPPRNSSFFCPVHGSARDVLDQLSTTAACITNNVPMVQTIDQIIGPVSDQFQAQQLGVQHTLYNNEFSGTARRDEELPRSAPHRCQPPAANHFCFSDYPPDDYYDHPQPPYEMPRTSHRVEDSRIKTIVDNMHPLIIDGAATNKRLLRFFISLENKFGYDASNHTIGEQAKTFTNV